MDGMTGLSPEGGGSRAELRMALAEADDPGVRALADAFAEMTPEQRAWGKLVGKLLEAHGNAEVDSAFSWFEVEHLKGGVLSLRERMLALFQAAESLGCDEAHYRLVRRMYVLANTN